MAASRRTRRSSHPTNRRQTMTTPTRTRAQDPGVGAASFARSSELLEDPPDRLFPALPAADFGEDDAASEAALIALAAKMTAQPELPKDGPDP
jgi:hypothetical protein